MSIRVISRMRVTVLSFVLAWLPDVHVEGEPGVTAPGPAPTAQRGGLGLRH